jgi:hypothetical protein
MHENRQISSAPWSDDQGLSAKATGRTTDMHTLEKSDCGFNVERIGPSPQGEPSFRRLTDGNVRWASNTLAA